MTASAHLKEDHVRPTLRTITKFKADIKNRKQSNIRIKQKSTKNL